MPLGEVDISSPALFAQGCWGLNFAKLQRERLVHYCPENPYGPYWFITRFDDIHAVELDHATFSFAAERGGIRIDNRLGGSFISSDPPRHTREPKTVVLVAAPINLASYWIMIRDRTHRLFASQPRNETFD